MALREVLKFPDKRLREISTPIDEITDEIRELAHDLLEVMYDEPGIGLAAPQLAQALRQKHEMEIMNPDEVVRFGLRGDLLRE